MRTAATRPKLERAALTLAVAFELGKSEWRLACTPGLDHLPLVRTIAARDLVALEAELARAKAHLGLPAHAAVGSCYEAGRDGFWLHRYLRARGVANDVVDSSSIEVNRRARRAKSDRLDACKLVTMLLRADAGEPRVWSVVRVPSVTDEDRRQPHRELLFVRRDRARLTNRVKGLLANQGLVLETLVDLPTQLAAARLWDGTPVPPLLRARLEREWRVVVALTERLQALRADRRALLETSDDPAIARVRQLLALRGIGPETAWLYVMEFFGWRTFRNRREVGALAGLVPTPYQSGDVRHEQGISRAGNRFIRAVAIDVAWGWLRYQPQSALTRWYQARFARGSGRVRKIGIVAVARKLLIALWQYLETGCIPEGAVLKA
ncbi:MAG TPA: IS110 family transposase [Gemmatimonadales bacterium]|nr:IS110 family transposase [Gemmatimonadales bacterium]